MSRDPLYNPVQVIRDVVKHLVMDSYTNKSSSSQDPYGTIALKSTPGSLFARLLKLAGAKYNGVLLWKPEKEQPIDEVTARLAQWYIDASDSRDEKSVVPDFEMPRKPITFTWWSWHPRHPYWSRSCWEAPTQEEALKYLSDPRAGLDAYHNKLIRHCGDHWEEVMDVPCKKMEQWRTSLISPEHTS